MFEKINSDVVRVYGSYDAKALCNNGDDRTYVGYIIGDRYVRISGYGATDALGRDIDERIVSRFKHTPRTAKEKYTFMYLRDYDWSSNGTKIGCIVKDNETGEFGVSLLNPTPTATGGGKPRRDQFSRAVARETAIANIGKQFQIPTRYVHTESGVAVLLSHMISSVIRDWDYL